MQLRDRTVLITGAAHGIGRALGRAFAARGARLALTDVDSDALRQTGEELPSPFLCVVDLARPEEHVRLKEEVESALGPVRILVNNAAFSVGGPLASTRLEDLDRIVDVNYRAVLRLTRLFLPPMLEDGEGRIVNISSALAFVGMPYHTLYSAAKSGIRGFSEALAAELHGTGVGVTVVHPGPVRTTMYDRSVYTDDVLEPKERVYLSRAGMAPERVAARIVRAVELDRFELLVGPQAKTLAWIRRIAPRLAVRFFGRYRDRLPA